MASTVWNEDGNKPPDWRLAKLSYHSLNFFYRKRFGAKVWKVSLDVGCTCPNRDGTLSTSGCIFCDPESFSPSRRRVEGIRGKEEGGRRRAEGGGRRADESYLPSPACGRGAGGEGDERRAEEIVESGEWRVESGENSSPQPLAPSPSSNPQSLIPNPCSPPSPFLLPPSPIAAQLDEGIRRIARRHSVQKFLAYFQPATNTYGPVEQLRAVYQEAAEHPQVVGLIVGTRPDCAGDEILDVLAELAKHTWILIEFGLQTIHNRTLDRLNRGHHFDAFLDAHRRCRQRGLNVGAHVILGLPGESRDDMLATARTLAGLGIHSIKPHNLYAVHRTVLADEVAAGRIRLPELDEYVGCLVDFLEETPGRVVIDRLHGDAPPEYIVGPQWCLDKAAVRAAVEAEFQRRGTWQGKRTEGEEGNV